MQRMAAAVPAQRWFSRASRSAPEYPVAMAQPRAAVTIAPMPPSTMQKRAALVRAGERYFRKSISAIAAAIRTAMGVWAARGWNLPSQRIRRVKKGRVGRGARRRPWAGRN